MAWVPNRDLISLFYHRYWVTEMHVDGFRFDLASIMTRGSWFFLELSTRYSMSFKFICEADFDIWLMIFLLWQSLWDAVNVYGIPVEGDLLTTGSPLSSPPLISMISNDPVLRGVKVFSLNFLINLYRCSRVFLHGVRVVLNPRRVLLRLVVSNSPSNYFF